MQCLFYFGYNKYVEIKIIKFFQSLKNDFFDSIFWLFTFFAGVFAVVIVFFILSFVNKRKALIFIIVSVLNTIINYILKTIINRPRPYELDYNIINSLKAFGKSFPSGHIVCATTIVLFLIYTFYTKINKKINKAIFLIALCLYLIGVAISRMYFGQHYLSDIFAGIILAILLCNLFLYIYKFLKKYKNV